MEIVSASQLDEMLFKLLPAEDRLRENAAFMPTLLISDIMFLIIKNLHILQPRIRWTDDGVWKVSMAGVCDVFATKDQLPRALSEAVASIMIAPVNVRVKNYDRDSLSPHAESDRCDQSISRSGASRQS